MIAIAVCAAVALGVGLLVSPAWGWVASSALLAALLWYHLRNLRAIVRWLESGEAPDPPRTFGVWDRFHALLHRSRREAAQREADLAEALARWRAVARALPDGVVILDGARIAWCNETARHHLEIDPERDSGTPLTHLVRIPDFLEYLDGGDYSHPIQVHPPHASERVLSMQAVRYGEDQRLVLSRDVTQFKQVERMRRDFVADVSHELRTPLTVIAGFLEALEDEKDPRAARRYVDLMAEQAQRMQRLVEDLLTLSSLESSPPPPLEERIGMKPLVERLAAEARALGAGRHRIAIDAQDGLDLLGSEKEIASAFGNLVSNAIRYTPQGGEVRLAWHATADGAEFAVEDTGIGIEAQHIPRLTERFYRVDRGRPRESGGTGLGLAIVKHALGRHGAALHVSSTPGQGSRFSARFTGPRVAPRR